MQDRGPSILLRRAGQHADDPRRILRVFDPSAGAHYDIYVHNFGVLSNSADDAKRRLDGIIRALETFGFVVHETEISSGKIQTLGVKLDCGQLVTRVTQARRSRLRAAIKGICRRRTVTGKMLQVVIGHCTFRARATAVAFDLLLCLQFDRQAWEGPCHSLGEVQG